MNRRETNIWKLVSLIAIVLLAIVSALYFNRIGYEKEKPVDEDVADEEISYLSLWKDDARAKIALEDYIKEITDETAPSYIPVENRIAVFDHDGTLFCETYPVYFDHMLFMHRVLEDPDHEATPFELEVAAKVQEFIDTGNYPDGLDNLHGQGVASAFAGMTVKEFSDYIYEYRQTPAPGYENMTMGDAFYLPMLEVLDLLQNNGFKTYIVSGTDRLIVRGIVDGLSFLNIPPNQIIGSDELLTTRKQGDTDGSDYVFTDDDELILAGEFIIKNLKMNKVSVIAQEIGIQPVLAFGNSSSDASMAKYTVSNNPYPSMAFMLCCDDTVRENGNEAKAEKMAKTCEENGWIPISMKNDWITIYGDEVNRR